MIAAWMLSAVLVGALVTAGALAADRLLSSLRRQTRFVWLGAMIITLAWPAIAYTRARLADGSAAAAPLRAGVQQMTAIMVRASEQSLHVRTDVVLIVAWLLVSVFLLARMFVTVRTLRMSGRAWRSQHVDGVEVRLSRDIGPAVIGFGPMEVVLPEWALDLEPPLRALVLAHEEEHRRARDPYLLLVSAALAVLVPWNPGLWVQSRRLRLAIELDCDARVLRRHPKPERYGLLLLAIAQRRTASVSLLAPALSEPTSNLERRINAMNNPLKNQSRVRLAVLGGVAVALVVVACAVDAPVAPMPKAQVRASGVDSMSARAEVRNLIADRVDSEIGWAVTKTSSDGKGVITNWLRDSTGKRTKLELRYDPERAAREHQGETRYKTLAPTMKEPNGPIVEQGVVTPRSETVPTSAERRNKLTARAEPQEAFKVTDASALYEYQVEHAAQWIAGTGTPRYPDELKAAGVDGEVLARFVVDVDGRVDSGSFKVLKFNDQRFVDAIQATLEKMQFKPAEVGGRAVRQVVQQSFVFSVK